MYVYCWNRNSLQLFVLMFQSRLQKCKVKVFEQPSQGYNMMLQIMDQGKPDVKEVAVELLGRTIFVAWPHLVEAR